MRLLGFKAALRCCCEFAQKCYLQRRFESFLHQVLHAIFAQRNTENRHCASIPSSRSEVCALPTADVDFRCILRRWFPHVGRADFCTIFIDANGILPIVGGRHITQTSFLVCPCPYAPFRLLSHVESKRSRRHLHYPSEGVIGSRTTPFAYESP